MKTLNVLCRKYDLTMEYLKKSECVELASLNAYNNNALRVYESKVVEVKDLGMSSLVEKVRVEILGDNVDMWLEVSDLDYLCYKLFEKVDLYY
jgi:hypothetical protein